MLFRFIIYSLALLSSICTPAQDSPEWAPIGAVWHYTFFNPSAGFSYLSVEVTGDTLINDTLAKVLKIYEPSGLTEFNTNNIYLYQENDVIYYLVKNRFTVLYDFSATLGDTLKLLAPVSEFEDDSIMYLRVDSISEYQQGNQTLKQQYLRPIEKGASNYAVQFSEWNTELFGNQIYMIPVSGIECDHACPIGLRCYSDDQISAKLVEFPCDTATFVVSTRNYHNIDQRIEISPNPSDGRTIAIKVDGLSGQGKMYYRIFDLSSKVLFESGRLSSPGQQETIEISLHAGIYLLSVRGDNWWGTKKFIVSP